MSTDNPLGLPETFASSAPGVMLISRTFAAPRELVFDAWTDPAQLVLWAGPRDFPVRHAESDPRPGGTINMTMIGPGGVEAPSTGEYEVVDRPELLVMRSWIEADGVRIHDTRATITFTQLGDYTRLTVETEVLHNDDFPGIHGAKEGWSQQLDKLCEYLVRVQ